MKKVGPIVLFAIFLIAPLEKLWGQEVVSFELRDGHILVQAIIDDSEKLNLIFDTGCADDIILDKAVAQKLGITFNETGREIFTASGPYKQKVSKGHSIDFGTYQSTNLDIAEVDFSAINEKSSFEIHGAIGGKFLTKYPFELNFDRSELSFYTNKPYQQPEGSTMNKEPLIGVMTQGFLITLRILLQDNKEKNLKLMVDTGARLTCLLFDFGKATLDWSQQLNEIQEKTFLGAMSGQAQTFYGQPKSISLDSHVFTEMPLYFQRPIEPDMSLGNGLVGLKLIEQFNVLFDFKNKLSYWKPNKNYKSN